MSPVRIDVTVLCLVIINQKCHLVGPTAFSVASYNLDGKYDEPRISKHCSVLCGLDERRFIDSYCLLFCFYVILWDLPFEGV